MDEEETNKTVHERLVVLVVHGVGEQGCYEHMEAIASNMKKALLLDKSAVHVELHYADSTPRLSPEHGWKESPVTLRWCKLDGRVTEIVFREVHWADLDMPNTYWNWIRLVAWSLSSPGVRLFKSSKAGAPAARNMRAPTATSLGRRLMMRLELFLVSLSFLLLLVTVGVTDQILKRLSWRLPLITRVLTLIYDYLGDVKLYQDWFLRKDERVEVIARKSRVSILRRMNRALIRTAAEVEEGKVKGFYVFAHSLGSVVAFNGLMEPGLSLPHCLSKKEWLDLPSDLKGSVKCNLPEWLALERPPWLDGDAAWRKDEVWDRDIIDRSKLFAGLRGFLTWGSPLDKFAALWPQIVLINNESPERKVQWINIADVQDIVGGKVDLIEPDEDSKSIGGLELKKHDNFRWSDQLFAVTAHTSYWKARKSERSRERLIDSVIDWLDGGAFSPPPSARPNRVSWLIFGVTSIVAFTVLLFALAWLLWAATTVFSGLNGEGLGELFMRVLRSFTDGTALSVVPGISLWLLGIGSATVIFFSVVRYLWEKAKFG